LVDLSLRQNSIKNFSFAILEHTKNVQKFDLSSNSIMRLENPTKIIFPEMRELNFADNHMSFIEDGVLNFFPNLEKLVLRNNPLNHFTNNTFKGLGKLLSLDLSQAKIVRIFDGYFSPLLSLQSLDLGRSLISMKEYFPNWTFKGLDNLKWLNLMNSSIGNSISDSLKHTSLRNLRYLDLSGNIITRIKNNTFSFLENLQILKLSHMKSPMQPIPSAAFIGLKKLKYLDLQDNYLTTLPLAALEPIKFAKVSLAYGNHFLCNCSLIPLKGDIVKGELMTDIQCRINSEKLFLSQMTNKDLGCTAPFLNSGKNETVIHTWAGSTAKIVCNASSTQEFPRLTYYAKEGNPVPPHKVTVLTNKTMTILPDHRRHFTTVKEIFIRKVETNNAGLVVCSGNTEYGKSECFVLLQVQERREEPLNKWTIGVVASLVTLLAVIIVIAVVITWRRKKNQQRQLANAQRRRNSDNSTETEVPRSNNAATPAEPQPVISETSL
jgi:Leucine-rich repeat (LRR) protein